MGVDIIFEKLGIVIGREDMIRQTVPQTDRGREKSSPVSYRVAELRSYNIRVFLDRLTGGTNRFVALWNNT